MGYSSKRFVVAKILTPSRMSAGPRAIPRLRRNLRSRLPARKDIGFVISGVRAKRHAMRDTPTPRGMREPDMKLKSIENGKRRKKTTRLKVHRARFSSASSSSMPPVGSYNSCN